MSESDLIALGRLAFERDIFGSYSGALGQPEACCGVVSNGCVSALNEAAIQSVGCAAATTKTSHRLDE